MPADDTFEDDLVHAISLTGQGFQSETGPLIEVGVTRGQVRRRRRTVAAVAGSATALALVGAGGVYLSGPAGPGRSPTVQVAATGTTSRPAPATTPPVVTADQVVATVTALLPAGQVSVVRANGTGGSAKTAGNPYVDLVFDDGHGKAELMADVSRVVSPAQGETACPDHKLVPYDGCTSNKLADGSTLTIIQGYEYPDRRVDTKNWSAILIGTDGHRITVSEWNSSQEKGAPITRPNPPLTPDQLGAVATAKSWDAIVAAVPEPAKPVQSDRRQFPGDQILAVAAKALPSGLTEADTSSSEGYVNFTVNDGKGVSMVEINVQDWRGDLKSHEAGDNTQPDTIAQAFSNAQTLPDGTKVTRQREGHRWVVDTLRPDGLRVVVAGYNSGGVQQPADRTAPALSYDQLQAIATSPGWPPLDASR